MSQENPYSAPQALLQSARFSRSEIVRLIFYGAMIGGTLGGLTNAANSLIGSGHFIAIFGWQENIWLKTVLQGGVEGSIYGTGNSLIFIIITNVFGRGIGSVEVVLKYFFAIAFTVFLCRLVGGCLGYFGGRMLTIERLPQQLLSANTYWQFSGNAWTLGSIRFAIQTSPLITFMYAAIYASRKARYTESRHFD